jgi:hypothetical protein
MKYIKLLIIIPILFTWFSLGVQAQGTPAVPVSGNGAAAPKKDDLNSPYQLLEPLPGVGATIDPSTGFGDYANKLIRLLIGAAGALAVVMIVIGGIQYMSSDAVGEKQSGKETMSNAVIGLGLALVSYLLLYTINPKLTIIKDNLVPSVSVEVKENASFSVISKTFTGGGGTFFADTAGGNPNVTKNITTYDTNLSNATKKYNPPSCTLLKAFMYAESGGNPNARSSVGAVGLVQLMPTTASGLGYSSSNLTDPATNTEAAAKYINQLYKTACNGKTSLGSCNVNNAQYVIAAYNGGPGANKESKDCPGKTWWQCEANSGYKETRGYVKRVMANKQKLESSGWGCN